MKDLRIELYVDGAHDMFVIKRDYPREGEPVSPGLNHLWFVLLRRELQEIVDGRISAAEDGYHKLSVMSDHWLFYDMECFPRDDGGVLSVKYTRVELPRTFMRAVLRLAKRTWKLLRANMPGDESERWRSPRVELTLTGERMRRICRIFGQGKGLVTLDMDENTREYLGQRLRECPKLSSKVEQVSQIAQNSTRGKHQRARLCLSKDLDGFYWRAFTPNGRFIMNGGIIDHGPKGSPEWSIHT